MTTYGVFATKKSKKLTKVKRKRRIDKKGAYIIYKGEKRRIRNLYDV